MRRYWRWLRKTAKKKGLPYQSLVNEILAGEMRKSDQRPKETNIMFAEGRPVLGVWRRRVHDSSISS
jgi:hypothetical protein